MATVNKFKRKTKTGISLYLDYRVNGKRIRELTGLKLKAGTDTKTRLYNKEVNIRFDYMRVEKEKEIMDGLASIPLAVKRQKVDFIEVFKKYMRLHPSEERRNTSTLKKLIAYNKSDKLPITDIDEDYLIGFKNYLESNLSGETPYDYFKYLRKVIKQAVKDGLFLKNPADDIKVSRKSNDPKESLTAVEVQLLANTDCANDTVKRAFLFSCFTGLRYCDIKVLKWSNISMDGVLELVQVKTNHKVSFKILDDAIELLGNRGNNNDLIFQMPTNAGTNAALKVWAQHAGIEKKITYHCSRHTFATLLTTCDVDILLTSKAMGHKTLKETQRYTKVSNSLVNDAVLKLESVLTLKN